jgi:hypothetical protein
MLITDLEESQKRISEFSAEIVAIKAKKDFFSESLAVQDEFVRVQGVRDVISRRISGSVSRSETRPDRGRLPFCGSDPPHAAPYKSEASRGTGTNVHRAHSAPQTLTLRLIKRGAEARGLAPPHLRHRPTTDASTPT